MGQWQNTRTGDVVDVPPALDDKYKADGDWKQYRASSGKAKNDKGGTDA